jgi:hypothetical protein
MSLKVTVSLFKQLYFVDFAQFMLILLIDVKCHTNFDTYKKTIGWFKASKGYTFKKGSLSVALNRFLGCACILFDGL